MTAFKDPDFPAIFTLDFLDLREFDKHMITVLGGLSQNLKGILDHGISLSDNMDVSMVTYTSNAIANTEDTILHLLGKTPTGYIPISKDKAADIYNTAAADKTNLKLKCTVASATIKLLVF